PEEQQRELPRRLLTEPERLAIRVVQRERRLGHGLREHDAGEAAIVVTGAAARALGGQAEREQQAGGEDECRGAANGRHGVSPLGPGSHLTNMLSWCGPIITA